LQLPAKPIQLFSFSCTINTISNDKSLEAPPFYEDYFGASLRVHDIRE